MIYAIRAGYSLESYSIKRMNQWKNQILFWNKQLLHRFELTLCYYRKVWEFIEVFPARCAIFKVYLWGLLLETFLLLFQVFFLIDLFPNTLLYSHKINAWKCHFWNYHLLYALKIFLKSWSPHPNFNRKISSKIFFT